MAAVLGKDIPIESQFMTDYWKFRKEFYIPEDNDEYWKQLHGKANSLAEKYGRESYMEDLIRVCVNNLETRYRRAKKDGQNKAGDSDE